MTLILGIDPGSRLTGYGLLRAQGDKLAHVHSGCIRADLPSVARQEQEPIQDSSPPPGSAQPQRLKQIFNGLCQIIEQQRPEEAAVEAVFMGRNADAALKLGQARGAAIAACVRYDLPVAEYSARKIKQALTGGGGSDKEQVRYMVARLMALGSEADDLSEDAADALAVAICHANTRASLIRMAGARRFSRRRLR